MSADEPLVNRLDDMINRVRETKNALLYQIEDVEGTLRSLKLAKDIAEMKERLERDLPFAIQLNIPRPYPDALELKIDFATHPQERVLIIAVLNSLISRLVPVKQEGW